MSSPLAIAAVTTALVDLLNNGLIDTNITTQAGDFGMSARSPGLIKIDAIAKAQLNLFMYMVTTNTAWSNTALPSRTNRGERLSNPPLALNLHYMLTAYGKADFQAEMLLGYAMHLLHETPVLTREALNKAFLANSVGHALLPSLATADLANQVEVIKITPQYLNIEELSKLWSAFQAPYQPTVAYQVSVVLIEGTQPTRAARPVLQRRLEVQPGTAPQLSTIELPERQASVQIGDSLTLRGENLSRHDDQEQVRLQFSHPRLNQPIVLPVQNPGADWIPIQISDDSLGWLAGTYAVTVQFVRDAIVLRATNALALTIAPRITKAEFLKVRISATVTVPTIRITCSPKIQPGQPYALLLDDQELNGQMLEQASDTLAITVGDVAAGTYLIRLRVDGVESLPINFGKEPLTFDPDQKVVIAP
ncbi:MAG: DUF4255 domain-containing protein [Roseiflexaceae bacterium]|nr:DUF4255 domain-containing protein [Roseiflexaceae bacterium]